MGCMERKSLDLQIERVSGFGQSREIVGQCLHRDDLCKIIPNHTYHTNIPTY